MFTTVAVVIAVSATLQQLDLRFVRWEQEVRGIEKRLAKAPPPTGGVLFVGSSSIRLWDTVKAFPDLPAANVGFGGSEVRDCTHFVPRLVAPHKPKTIVFYAGDNDIASGRTAVQVRDDFGAFVAAVRKPLPDCRVLFVAVKPSPKRWKLFDVQTKANDLVKAWATGQTAVRVIDVVTPALGPDGKPKPELFVKDELHLSAAGYEIWKSAVKDALVGK
jgi:lysophospholipase L1-like esterase